MVAAVTIMAVAGLVAIVALQYLRPEASNIGTLQLIVAFLMPTITSLVAVIKVKEVHVQLNSRLTELLAVTKTNAMLTERAQMAHELHPTQIDSEGKGIAHPTNPVV